MKIRKNTPKIRKNTEKSEKYSENLEKYIKFGQNTPVNSEKYSRKLGKILRKIRKNTPQKPGSQSQNHFFQLCLEGETIL